MTKHETTPPFHLGQLIKDRAKELRIGPTELGSIIHTSKQNIYGIFKRRSLNSDLIYKLSEVLEHDFFTPFSDSLGLNQEKDEIRKKVPQLQRQIKHQQEEIDNLKTLVKLLEKESH